MKLIREKGELEEFFTRDLQILDLEQLISLFNMIIIVIIHEERNNSFPGIFNRMCLLIPHQNNYFEPTAKYTKKGVL